MLRLFRRIWRLLRLFSVTLIYTTYLSIAVRRRPAHERDAFRAQRQQKGTALLCRILGVDLVLEGKLPQHQPMLLVCNHIGILDPLVLASKMPVSFAGKAEIRAWPFLGWVCEQMGLVFVERGRPTQAGSFVQQVQAKLDHAVQVLVFPEGTTSLGDRVRPFKTGAFEAVAELADRSVLPLHLGVIAVEGDSDPSRYAEVAWADGTETFEQHCWHLLGLRSITMRLQIGTAIATAGRNRKTLARLAHAQVSAMHEA